MKLLNQLSPHLLNPDLLNRNWELGIGHWALGIGKNSYPCIRDFRVLLLKIGN
jgi:hypothetical protein